MKSCYTTFSRRGEWKFPLLSPPFSENIQTQIGLSRVDRFMIHVIEKLKNALGARLMPREVNFSSSLSTLNIVAAFSGSLWWLLAGTSSSHPPRFKTCKKEDVYLFQKFQEQNHCILMTLFEPYVHL